MKKFALGLILVCSVGCCNAPTAAVAEQIEVLRDNTKNLGERYRALLLRSSAAEGQSADDWDRQVRKDTVLTERNLVLANKVLEWANKASGKEKDQ